MKGLLISEMKIKKKQHSDGFEPSNQESDLIQANVFVPPIFIAHEPQIPVDNWNSTYQRGVAKLDRKKEFLCKLS